MVIFLMNVSTKVKRKEYDMSLLYLITAIMLGVAGSTMLKLNVMVEGKGLIVGIVASYGLSFSFSVWR